MTINHYVHCNDHISIQLPSLSRDRFVINVNAKLPSHRNNDNGMDKPHNKIGKIV